MVLILLVITIINPTIPNKVFENEFIKFNYPTSLNVVDNSNNTTLNVTIYDGPMYPSDYKINAIGAIFVTNRINKDYSDAVNANKFKNTTISGYDAVIEYDQGDSGASIYLNEDAVLHVLLNPSYDPYVNSILNSFIVKKVPPKVTYNR